MDLSKAREHYIKCVRFDLEEDDFIVLREPTTLELKDFGENGKENLDTLIKIFPKAIVEHSFTDSGNPAKATQVAAVLMDSGTKFTEIIKYWMQEINLDEKKSEK